MAEFRNVGKFYRSLDKLESYTRGIGEEAEETLCIKILLNARFRIKLYANKYYLTM